MSEEALVLEAALRVLHKALDDLVTQCTGPDGKPQAPDRQDIMAARRMLPPGYRNTLATGGPVAAGVTYRIGE